MAVRIGGVLQPVAVIVNAVVAIRLHHTVVPAGRGCCGWERVRYVGVRSERLKSMGGGGGEREEMLTEERFPIFPLCPQCGCGCVVNAMPRLQGPFECMQ